ncbi:MAG: RES family NAD+ phosphorylase [Candidatus Cybelea sp.]
MLRPAALRMALRSAPANWFIDYNGPLYRALCGADLPHAAFSNPKKDHRFNRGTMRVGSFTVLYASTDTTTPLFETRRRIQTATEIINAPGPATHLAILSCVLFRLLDLRGDDARRGLKTNHQELTGNWWDYIDSPEGAPTHWLGNALHAVANSCGVIYRSKYGTGDNVFIMHDQLAPGYVHFERSTEI